MVSYNNNNNHIYLEHWQQIDCILLCDRPNISATEDIRLRPRCAICCHCTQRQSQSTFYTQGEVTSQSLWSRYDRHFVGITRHNALS